ncbi:MAG: hypothetical protein ACKVWR_00280 [Acidimicrobiales bacterium]
MNRQSAHAKLGWRATAAAALSGLIVVSAAGVADARVSDECRFARNNLHMFQSMLDDAHARQDQESIQYWRGNVFDAQLEVLGAC